MKRGFTIVELLLVVGMLVIFSTVTIMLINPVTEQKKARDNVRLSDASTLSRAIEEYILDNKTVPDTDVTLRTSDALPQGNTGPLTSITQGWINTNFTGYLTKLPVDPLNTETYVYSFKRNANKYELNLVLEHYVEIMQTDSGNNAAKYELGTDLTILN